MYHLILPQLLNGPQRASNDFRAITVPLHCRTLHVVLQKDLRTTRVAIPSSPSKNGAASEPAHVEKVRLARRAGRKTRYEQVVEKHEQRLTAKEIACQLNLSEPTVQR